MKTSLRLLTVLLAALAVGCATSGSLGALRADHNEAEATRVKAETEAAAAAKRQEAAEQRKKAAGEALAGGLVKAATDDVAAAEAARKRAEAKRAEACGLNPALPGCKAPAPPPPAASPPQAPSANPPAPTPKANPASAPAAPRAEPEEAPAPEADEEEATDAEPPHAHIRLVKGKGDKTFLTFVQPLPDKWGVDWKSGGVLAVTIGGKEAYTVKTDRLGVGNCWRLGISDEGAAIVSEEQCPSAEGE